jgi:hypothetical protein
MIARSLITSIDSPPEEDVESSWLELAQKRLSELDSGKVQAVTWESIQRVMD